MRRGSKFWKHVWRYYDSQAGLWMPNRLGPWLFGMACGAKGRRVN